MCIQLDIVVMVFLFHPSEEVDAIAKKLKLKLFRTSAKENFNVDKGVLVMYAELPALWIQGA